MNKGWDWDDLSYNPAVTWDIVRNNSDIPWDWIAISHNPNITWEIIMENPTRPWEWEYISGNPNITVDIIENNPDKPWDWNVIWCNPNITLEFIEKNKEKINFEQLSHNKFLWDDAVYKREIAKDIRSRVAVILACDGVCRDLMRGVARYIDYC